MKTEQFIQRLRPLPPRASSNEIKALEQIIEQYPWCGIVRQLYLEALQQSDDERFTDYIPKAAMYVVHREQLYHRLQQFKTRPTTQEEDILIIEEEPITSNLSLVAQEEEPVTEPAPSEAKESPLTQEEEPVTCNLSLVTQEEEPVTEPAPSEAKEPLVTRHSSPVTKNQLFISAPSDYFAGELVEIDAETDPITRFIVERPRITPIAGPLMSIELPNQIEQAAPPKKFEDIVSETLAKIYEDQGLVSLAKSTYEKLCLLKPKKSAYFAARIQNLKFKL